MPYLWRFNIPTMEAYSQTVEPAMYAVVSRLLDRPWDGQVRNITMVTQTNFPVMESLGIRFLIADYAIRPPARLVSQLVAPPISHFLYELPEPNLGDYSPTQVMVAGDASNA